MVSILLLVFPIISINAQVSVDDWFFPVSVSPPQDNSIYDDDVNIQQENEVFNKTNQEIIDYYDKDKLEKWRNQKTNFQPVFKNKNDVEKNETMNSKKVDENLAVQKSTKFLPDSGIPVFIPQPPELNVNMNMNEEPIISMSMVPIKSLGQPEEIAKIEHLSKRRIDSEYLMPPSTSPMTTPPIMIISTTSHVTTKAPFVYEITQNVSKTNMDYNIDMKKLRRDVSRLRNEMNLVKSLLNKLYRKSYKKQKDYVFKQTNLKTEDETIKSEHVERQATRLSALQTKPESDKWVVINGSLRRINNIEK